MDNVLPKPCARWAPCLAARHPSDLSVEEAAALSLHLKSCQDCAAVYASYALMEDSIRQLPPVMPLERVPVLQHVEKMAALRQEETAEPILRSLIRRWERPWGLQPIQVTSLLAALLVVFVLISDSLTFFSSAHQTKPASASVSTSAHSCQAEAALDGSLAQLCRGGLLTEIDQYQLLWGNTITVEKAYIDANQMLFEYSLHRSASSQQMAIQLDAVSLVLQDHSNPTALNGLRANQGYFSIMTTQVDMPVMVSVPNTGTFPQKPGPLDVRLTMGFVQMSPLNGTIPIAPTTSKTSFSFQLSYHMSATFLTGPGFTGSAINKQQKMASSITLMLFQTVVSQSMIAFYVSASEDALIFSPYLVFFQGQVIEGWSSVSGPNVLQETQHPYYVFSVFTSSVYGQHGELILHITSVNDQREPWIFMVEIP